METLNIATNIQYNFKTITRFEFEWKTKGFQSVSCFYLGISLSNFDEAIKMPILTGLDMENRKIKLKLFEPKIVSLSQGMLFLSEPYVFCCLNINR